MKIACSSQSFDLALLNDEMSLEEFYSFCSTFDFIKGVELEDKHLKYPHDAEYLAQVLELSKKFGLPIVNLAFDCNFGYKSEEKLEKELVRVRTWVEVAKALEIPRFRLFAGWPDENKENQWPKMIEYLKQGAAIIKEAGMTVVVENHNHGGFLSNSDDVVRMFDDVGSDVITLLLDTGNYVDELPGVLKTAKWSGHVHAKVKEIDDTGRPITIDYPPMVKVLAENQYNGFLSIEYEGDLEPKQIVKSFGNFLNDQIKLQSN
ncbi:Sugar phosphate isomerase/epimerase [Paenibacillus sp. yr247]|uniref:sugar phosphate isomerase/epimerase family protein n=1 Tax=Paenibacillus sp. yr247 TaxID=1761880 RepID=UPI000890736D|nr:sugar phosphate isomerase/epimerase family protein [Paenibacillus sp. yr247]SDP09552.1 Sugar phosphate isomerase/epimerase [Paenibacillus sp. yr247]